jgi:hypothetical protein
MPAESCQLFAAPLWFKKDGVWQLMHGQVRDGELGLWARPQDVEEVRTLDFPYLALRRTLRALR